MKENDVNDFKGFFTKLVLLLLLPSYQVDGLFGSFEVSVNPFQLLAFGNKF